MEWMDRPRRAGGFLWVGAGLLFQVLEAFRGGGGVVPGPVTLTLVTCVLGLALLLSVRAPARLTRFAGCFVAILIALDFLGAVADRFGVLGSPGDAGVSWGSWSAFVDYTDAMLNGIARPVAEAGAVAATVVELVLAGLLLSGWQRRWVAKATSGLLALYTLLMWTSMGAGEVAKYAVPILVGGALLVSVCVTGPKSSVGVEDSRHDDLQDRAA